tara:strand:+ start:657 stop:1376 length:720 start_codon:yes stop_codon:yes gene_type:complete
MENKTSRYFKYAIGEIILVVIGILIALQVSNWNDKRLFDQKMEIYYSKLFEEIESQLIFTKGKNLIHEDLAKKLNSVLDILATKNYLKTDTLKKNLGAVVTAWSANYSLNVFNEFISQDLLSQVADPELKNLFIELKNNLSDMNSMDTYNADQYNSLIEPFIANNMNYATIALPRYKKGLKQGGPTIDYKALFNSVELWNVTTFKLETTNLYLRNFKRIQNVLLKLKIKLETYNLEKND